nr:hypothetical protein [Tanacetum cinerariifolium]
MQTQTSNSLYNAIMEAGSKDRPPMLAPGNYIKWKSRIKRYIDTKPNRELIHYYLENRPYELGWKNKFIIDAEGNPTTATHQAPRVVKPEIRGNVNFEIKSQFMRELREDTFSENKNEDPHDHVDRVLNIGLIPGMTQTQDLTAIQTMADHPQKWHDGTSSRNISNNDNTDRLAAIVSKHDNLGHDIKKLKENVHAIQVGCQIVQESYEEIVYKCSLIAQETSGELRSNLTSTKKKIHLCTPISCKKEGVQEIWASCSLFEEKCDGGSLCHNEIKCYWESEKDGKRIEVEWDNLSLNDWLRIRFGEDPDGYGESKENKILGTVLNKLYDEWFKGTYEDDDNLEGLIDCLEPTLYDGFVDSDDEE